MAMYVYSTDGDPVGFVFETYIYDLDGSPLGRIVGCRVHRFDGTYVGEWFKDMVVRRPQGRPRLIPPAGSPERLRWHYWMHFAEGSAMLPLMLGLTVQFERGDQSKPYRHVPMFSPEIAKKRALLGGSQYADAAVHDRYLAPLAGHPAQRATHGAVVHVAVTAEHAAGRRGDRGRTREIDHPADVLKLVELPCPVVAHNQDACAVFQKVVALLFQGLFKKYAIDASEFTNDLYPFILTKNCRSSLLLLVQ